MIVAGTLEERFTGYVEALSGTLAHADREQPFAAYCRGLILPGERKSIEPMAARVRPERVSATHQSLHHLVAKAAWSDEALLAAARHQVLPALGPITAWIIDDTGFPKKGKHSVGVARQYCGQLGKQDNCQVAVSLSVANEQASLPVAYRLYLPQAWADDPTRRHKAGVPQEVTFKTKPEIALEQIRDALKQGVSPGVVLADAGYGADMDFQEGLLGLDLAYVVGIQPNTSLWPPGTGPLPAKPWSGRGRPPTRLRRQARHEPVAAEELARSLSAEAWQTVTWREGTKGTLTSRLAALRVRPGHRDYDRSEPWPELWLLAEWPESEEEVTKYWLANLPADTPLPRLVGLTKLRWRIERDYQELKQELGLGHFEGRSGAALPTAWLSSSRLLVHRGLWLPRPRASAVFPCRPRCGWIQDACLTPRFPRARLPGYADSGTCRTPSPPCTTAWPCCSPDSSISARAVTGAEPTGNHHLFMTQ